MLKNKMEQIHIAHKDVMLLQNRDGYTFVMSHFFISTFLSK
jgi:hypothetical protein